LGITEDERGTGLQHVYFQDDGLTDATALDGVPCRQLNLKGRNSGYLYFIIDPTFKSRGTRDVTIEFDYFDEKAGVLGIEIDASETQQIPNAAYANVRQLVHMNGSKEWKTAKFDVHDATFKNRQNSKCDFRIWVTPPEVRVRSVTVTRGIEKKAINGSSSRTPDFSKKDSVSKEMGGAESETDNGLRHFDWEKDGITVRTNLNGVLCRHLKLPRGDTGYFYFAIDPSFKKRNIRDAMIEVEYFDAGAGTLSLEFDAFQPGGAPNSAYRDAGHAVRLTDSRTWRTALFTVRSASFSNAQGSGADFRLCAHPADLFVRRVLVTRPGHRAELRASGLNVLNAESKQPNAVN
jgi:hypothetical protein